MSPGGELARFVPCELAIITTMSYFHEARVLKQGEGDMLVAPFIPPLERITTDSTCHANRFELNRIAASRQSQRRLPNL